MKINETAKKIKQMKAKIASLEASAKINKKSKWTTDPLKMGRLQRSCKQHGKQIRRVHQGVRQSY